MQTVALHERAQRSAAYVQTSFTARVPALVDGDFSLSESSAIIEYLEDKWPPPAHAALCHGTCSSGRGRARSWPGSAATCAHPRGALRRIRVLPARRAAALRAAVTGRARAVDKLVSFAERVVPADGGPLFGAWCIADTDLAMMLQRLVKTGEPLPARLRAFAEREWQRPSVQAYANASRPPHRPAPT